jgi:HEAT repeat protein
MSVDWDRLEHHHGFASDVPDLLSRCAGPDAEDALDTLEHLLYHQGDWICPAASAALPFLLDLAENPAVPIRGGVVSLIALLVDEAATVEPEDVDPGWAIAVERVLPRMLALLDDPDPRVRREAGYLVSRPGLPVSSVSAALWRLWKTETDRVTRWDLALALGELPPSPDVRAALHAALDQAADPQLALAALHALARTEPSVTAGRRERAMAAIRHADVADWRNSAWLGGDSDQIITKATARLFARSTDDSGW